MSDTSLAMLKLSTTTASAVEAPSPTGSDSSAVNIKRPAIERLDVHDQNNSPQLKREWSFWSLFAFSTLTLDSWEGAASLLAQSFLNGGPSTLLYGAIGLAIGVSCIYASLAELASLQPMIGAQYVWTAQFAPRRLRPFATFVQGWLTTLAWQSIVPAVTYLNAFQLRGVIILLAPVYEPQDWHICLMMIFILLFSCMAAILYKRSLPMVAILVAVFYFLVFFAVLITALARNHHAGSSFVWQNDQSFYTGNMPGISYCVGFATMAFIFAGSDSIVHLSEETHHPDITVPRAMMTSFVTGVTCAFATSVVLLYGVTDVVAIFTTATGSPMIEILRQATGSTAAAATFALLMQLTGLMNVTVAVISTSRLTWAFTRDGAFLGRALYLDRISPTYGVPMYAVFANTAVSILLSLIVIGSSIVFEGIISFATLSFYASYFIAIAVFLHHRLTKKGLVYGPWRLGKFGIPINITAICCCIFLMIFLPFPLTYPVTWENMNYAGPVLGLILVASTATWFCGAKRYFRGPILQIRVAGEAGQESFNVFSRAEWLSEDTVES